MSGYVVGLRRCVGHAPLLLTAAGVILYKGTKVLLQRRADNGTWAIHGGAVELGETVEEAAKRELREEIGIVPRELELYKVVSGEDAHYICANGDEVYGVSIVFLCSKWDGELRHDSHEVLGVEWFDVDNLPANINQPCDKAILAGIDKVLLGRCQSRSPEDE